MGARLLSLCKKEFEVRKCVCMKRKICGALAFMLLLFSCLGALAEDLQFDSSREVADYLEQAGKKICAKGRHKLLRYPRDELYAQQFYDA